MNDCYHSVFKIAEKNRVWKRILFHLSPIAMRLSRYAGATPGTGCCGDFIAGDVYRTGSCPLFELKCFLSKNVSP